MNLLPLILKKRDGANLSKGEIEALVESLTSKNRPPDYQVSALLAFIVAQGMSDEETLCLTNAMKNSGNPFEYKRGFSKGAFFVDKHSTGGVGDKITLPLAPLVVASSENIHFPTIAGRALGHTGGTVDKLESIPGFSTALSRNAFYKVLSKERLCFLSQTKDIAPADRELYFLRDVTGTVASVPLITASILSKKLSESLDFLLIDLKTGTGAFLPDHQKTRKLGESLLRVLKLSGTGTEIWMTNMDSPLGQFSGNRLEVIESISILKGQGPALTTQLTKKFAARLLAASGIPANDCESRINQSISSGHAYEIFERICRAQGGKLDQVEKKWKTAKLQTKVIKAPRDGFLQIDSTLVGLGLSELGAGRKRKTDKVDPDVGLEHSLCSGDSVKKGQEILKIHYRKASLLESSLKFFDKAYRITETQPTIQSLIIDVLK